MAARFTSNNPAGRVSFDNCVFRGNVAVGSSALSGDGGAIYIYLYSKTIINGSTFIRNLSGHHTYSTGEPAAGGAIASFGGLEVHNSVLRDNQSHLGGAVFSYRYTTVINTVFSGNLAYTQLIPDFPSLVPGGYGGAMFIGGSSANVTLSGVVIASNTSTENGGGIYSSGASATSTNRIKLVNSIMWGNKNTKFVDVGDPPIPAIKQQISTGQGVTVDLLI